MVGNRRSNERETKPRASLALAGARTKAQEGVGGPFRRQARAIVRDLDRRCLIARRHSELYLCGSVFDRIADQVVEHARQDRAVSRGIKGVFAIMRHDLRPVIAGDRKGAVGGFIDQSTQVGFANVERRIAKPGKFDKCIGEIQRPACMLAYSAKANFRRVAIAALARQAKDGDLRRAHVMRQEFERMAPLSLGAALVSHVGQRIWGSAVSDKYLALNGMYFRKNQRLTAELVWNACFEMQDWGAGQTQQGAPDKGVAGYAYRAG